MSQLPEIDELDIRNRVDSRSFTRGRRYFQQGAIINPRRQGDRLKAQCYGSMPHPYQVWVQLGEEGIEAGECSCPVGVGGYGKHAAALLLTWLDEPGSFLEAGEMEKALAKRKKADLIALEGWGDGISLLDEWFPFDHPEPRLAHIEWLRYIPPLARVMGIFHSRLGLSVDNMQATAPN